MWDGKIVTVKAEQEFSLPFFAEKQTNKQRYIGFKSSEFDLKLSDPKKKNSLERLFYVYNIAFYILVQQLALL